MQYVYLNFEFKGLSWVVDNFISNKSFELKSMINHQVTISQLNRSATQQKF